jgi:hypothetical protein
MTQIIDAILAINPNAEATIENNDFNKITWNNNTTPISQSDIETKIEELKQADADKETKKTSGKQKLIDLGLTEEEIKALIGG